MGNMWKCSNVHTWLSIDNYFLLEWWRFTFFFILKQVSAHMQLVCHIKFHVDFWRYWGERETKSREQSSLCSTWRNAVSNSPSLIPTRSTILVPIINPKPTSLWFPVIWASNRPILQLNRVPLWVGSTPNPPVIQRHPAPQDSGSGDTCPSTALRCHAPVIAIN